MFSLESTCNHHKTTFPGERYKTKVLATPTGTQNNSIFYMKSRHYSTCCWKQGIAPWARPSSRFHFMFCFLRVTSTVIPLVNSKYGAEYTSLSGAVGKNVTVCLFPQVNETLQFLYPSLWNILEVEDATDMVNYIKDETCGAGIFLSFWGHTLRRQRNMWWYFGDKIWMKWWTCV